VYQPKYSSDEEEEVKKGLPLLKVENDPDIYSIFRDEVESPSVALM
jgi:hypothetical protein